MINDYDISIIVQGPIIFDSACGITNETTKLVCIRLRKLFPNSEIILSTWKGSKYQDIIYDKLVLNDDPGAIWFNKNDYKTLNNCNRLIVSTKAGINAATRKYILKVRSDLIVISKSFLKYFYKYPYFDEKYKFVKNRIIAFSIYSIQSEKTPDHNMPRPFHISDWAYFGYREDIKALLDISLTKEPDFSHWFRKRPKNYYDIFPERLWKMSPEQYITTQFFKKYIYVDLKHTADITNNNVELSKKLIANNFLVLDQSQFCLISIKHLYLQIMFSPMLAKTAIFFRTWLQNYYQYCKVPISLNWWIDKIKTRWQTILYGFLNKLLRLLNFKFSLVVKLLVYLLKKLK